MVQIGVGAWAERGTARSTGTRTLRHGPGACHPAFRIHMRPRVLARQPEHGASGPAASVQPTLKSPQIRLQPIVAKPLQPFVMRESACSYLECRAAGRRCLAANERPVELDYQIAYCLGPRHASCRHLPESRAAHGAVTPRRLAYAAAIIAMVGLLTLAALQAGGLGSTTAMSRIVGLG